MRIAFFIPSLHGGGAEFVTLQWARELTDRGHEVVCLTYEPGSHERDARLWPRTYAYSSGGRLGKLGLPLWLRRQVRAHRIDVVVAMMTYSNLIALAALRPGSRSVPPVVISERTMPSIGLPMQDGRAGLKMRAAKALYPRAGAALAISHAVAADLVAGFRVAPERIFVVPNPAIDEIAPRTDAAATPPDPDAPRRLLFVGRLVPQKQPDRFVDLLATLRERGHPVTGCFVGVGPLEQAVRAHAQERGVDIEWCPWTEPWTALGRPGDCVVLPSKVEGFGNVLVEATAAGLPVVVPSQALGVADAVVPGVSGALALSSTPEDLADAVLDVWAQPALPTAASVAWLDRFSRGTSTTILLKVLERAVEAKRRTAAGPPSA